MSDTQELYQQTNGEVTRQPHVIYPMTRGLNSSCRKFLNEGAHNLYTRAISTRKTYSSFLLAFPQPGLAPSKPANGRSKASFASFRSVKGKNYGHFQASTSVRSLRICSQIGLTCRK